MLYIKSGGDHPRQWHIGDSMPKSIGRVVTFQADGHELEMILLAMRKAYVGADSSVGLQPIGTIHNQVVKSLLEQS